VLLQSPDTSGSTYANPPPAFRHWRLVLKYFRY